MYEHYFQIRFIGSRVFSIDIFLPHLQFKMNTPFSCYIYRNVVARFLLFQLSRYTENKISHFIFTIATIKLSFSLFM